jgi:hypothetical protein
MTFNTVLTYIITTCSITARPIQTEILLKLVLNTNQSISTYLLFLPLHLCLQYFLGIILEVHQASLQNQHCG